MSAGVGGGGEDDSDFEINLAPIIDCFTVLITYLLVSASFITLDLLNVSVVTTSDSAPPDQPLTDPPYSLTLRVGSQKNFIFKISGGPGNQEFNFPVQPNLQGTWNYEALSSELSSVLRRYPSVKEVSVTAEPDVFYQDIVAAIEKIKTQMPKVYVGE